MNQISKTKSIMSQFIFSFVWESLALYYFDFLTAKHFFEFELGIFASCLSLTIVYCLFFKLKEMSNNEFLLQLIDLLFISIFFSCLECIPFIFLLLLSKWMTLLSFLGVWLPILVFKLIVWKNTNKLMESR